jgi:hypothetical protein
MSKLSDFENIMSKSRSFITDKAINDIIINNLNIIEISSISCISEIEFDLIISCQKDSNFICNEIILSNGVIAKVKVIET